MTQQLRLAYRPVPDWPGLAWLSYCRKGTHIVEVFHGSGVETTGEWFSEAVWAGEFTCGDFDQTDIVAGSGGRARNRGIIFVSSGSTVDRLHSLVTADGVLVSNSLCCLLAMAGGSLELTYPDFHTDFSSINKGLPFYKSSLASSAGPVMLTYFDNLIWNGHVLAREPKTKTAPTFKSFEVYHDFLASCMHSVVRNAMATTRRRPFEPLCPLSNGYDSPTVAVLAKNFGECRRAFSFDKDRDGCDDSGETIAGYLGMSTTVIPRHQWRTAERPEIPFIAGSPGGSDVLFTAAKSLLANSVVFTGFYGDAIWAKYSTYRLGDLERGDGSGRSLTEFRLQAGFIHCPVPFWGAQQGQEIVDISRSPAMQTWDVAGYYSRPICRRIVEEAGIPRELFGNRKRGASVQLYRPEHFLTPSSRADYYGWLQENRDAWMRQFRVPPIPTVAHALDIASNTLRKLLNGMEGKIPAWYGLKRTKSFLRQSAAILESIQHGVKAPFYVRRYTFPWAVERQKQGYVRPSSLHTAQPG